MSSCRLVPRILTLSPFKRPFSASINSISNNIIPECFKPETPAEVKAKVKEAFSMNVEELEEISFHTLAAGGYNGLLAKSFEYSANPNRIAQIHASMMAAGVPKSQTTYNYLIAAYLKMRKFPEAYKLVFEMESHGLGPNLMTFEVLLTGLSYLRGTERVVDEMFELMQVKYELTPTLATWTARLTAWIHRRCEKRAISMYKSLIADHQLASKSAPLHAHLLKMAVRRRCWDLAALLTKNIRTKQNPLGAVVSMSNLKEIWSSPSLFEEAESLTTVRFLFEEIKALTMEESALSTLLYFSYRCGLIAADMADYAMNGLLLRYRNPDRNTRSNLPLHYIETYVHCMKPRNEEEIFLYDQLVTPSIKMKLGRFERLIKQ